MAQFEIGDRVLVAATVVAGLTSANRIGVHFDGPGKPYSEVPIEACSAVQQAASVAAPAKTARTKASAAASPATGAKATVEITVDAPDQATANAEAAKIGAEIQGAELPQDSASPTDSPSPTSPSAPSATSAKTSKTVAK